MRRIRWAALGFLAAGCAGFDAPRQPVVGGRPELNTPPVPTTPASTDVAARVETVGRGILAANPISGLAVVQTNCREGQTVRFTTIGAPQAEVFHRGSSEVFITEGLVRQCTTDGQLAAVLCLELGKLVSEREALTPVAVRQPERLPPIDTGIGRDNGYSGSAPDQTRLRELADYDRDKRQRQLAAAPPDPAALARLYLVRAGYHDADLQAVGPLLQQARGNSGLEQQLTGPTR
jgi:hypothetical protein